MKSLAQHTPIKKPTKQEAWEALNELYEQRDPEPRELYLMGKLYAYFLPPVPTKPKTAWQWVAKAVPKNDIRFYLNYVYVEGQTSENFSRVIGTDGHRVHIAPNTENLAPGYYDIAGKPVKVDATYPNIDKVIPARSGKHEINLKEIGAPLPTTAHSKPKWLCELTRTNGRVYVDKTYLDDATAGMKNPIAFVGEAMEAIRIEDKAGENLAIVMPCRGPIQEPAA